MSILAPNGARQTAVAPVWVQREMTLAGSARGFHLITGEVVEALPELSWVDRGVAHVFIKHTSASLTINENIAEEVLADFRSWFDRAVAEGATYWTHVEEGLDDMPAHIKSSLLGPSVTIPVRHGELLLGQYQGIYLCEHRNARRPCTLVLTLWGQGTGIDGG